MTKTIINGLLFLALWLVIGYLLFQILQSGSPDHPPVLIQYHQAPTPRFQ